MYLYFKMCLFINGRFWRYKSNNYIADTKDSKNLTDNIINQRYETFQTRFHGAPMISQTHSQCLLS